jgi:hypothetical protein
VRALGRSDVHTRARSQGSRGVELCGGGRSLGDVGCETHRRLVHYLRLGGAAELLSCLALVANKLSFFSIHFMSLHVACLG